jgi:hypothetical protein
VFRQQLAASIRLALLAHPDRESDDPTTPPAALPSAGESEGEEPELRSVTLSPRGTTARTSTRMETSAAPSPDIAGRPAKSAERVEQG